MKRVISFAMILIFILPSALVADPKKSLVQANEKVTRDARHFALVFEVQPKTILGITWNGVEVGKIQGNGQSNVIEDWTFAGHNEISVRTEQSERNGVECATLTIHALRDDDFPEKQNTAAQIELPAEMCKEGQVYTQTINMPGVVPSSLWAKLEPLTSLTLEDKQALYELRSELVAAMVADSPDKYFSLFSPLEWPPRLIEMLRSSWKTQVEGVKQDGGLESLPDAQILFKLVANGRAVKFEPLGSVPVLRSRKNESPFFLYAGKINGQWHFIRELR
jgi:hypothetical protein